MCWNEPVGWTKRLTLHSQCSPHSVHCTKPKPIAQESIRIHRIGTQCARASARRDLCGIAIDSQAVTLQRITPLQHSMLLQRMLTSGTAYVSTNQVLSLLKHPRLFATASECAHAQACVAYVLRTAIGRSVSAVFAALDC